MKPFAKMVKVTEIITFVMTRKQVYKFRERMGKSSRKIRRRDIVGRGYRNNFFLVIGFIEGYYATFFNIWYDKYDEINTVFTCNKTVNEEIIMVASKNQKSHNVGERSSQKAKKNGKNFSKVTSKIKPSVVQNLPTITPEQMKSILDGCYEKALDGIPNVSKSVHDLAQDYTSKTENPIKAANALINYQIVKCTTSGFLAGLGGLITLPVTIPVNVSSVMYVQLRMVAAIAEIGGYDPHSDQVQTLAYACLTGQAIETVLKNAGIRIGNKLAINGISKISGATLTKINQAVGFRLITKFGETGIINMGKAVPVVGGIIGGGFDLFSTKIIANNACRIFLGTQYSDSDLKVKTSREDE